MSLRWVTSGSADAQHHDQEIDLASLGHPGGAEWASVAPASRRGHKTWCWEVFSTWAYDERGESSLARGETDTEDEAKQSVVLWIKEQTGIPLD